MSELTVRPAAIDDIPALTALSSQLGYPSGEDDVRRRLEDLRLDADSAVFVAEADGRVVGWIQLSIARMLESEARAEVRGFVVDEGHRSAGVGARLLARADTWAAAKGLAKVRVPCNVTRERAHSFYLREGFREVKVQRIFERSTRPRSPVGRP
ncbi:MAG TPA: GNAT family N-acetyltransferase [Thermoanaerobaculia bacterium]|jgi:GNAT superfamily N-acetyltransferase|nr:GNAT family N-acetyltransferase [Thermoanaerobaculia bacterium]